MATPTQFGRSAAVRLRWLVVAVFLLSVCHPGSAHASAGPPDPPAGGPYLGVLLDPAHDSPAAYRDRLRLAPAVYGYDAPLPLGPADVRDLRSALEEVHDEGAGLLVSLRPQPSLSSIDARAVSTVVRRLSEAGVGRDVPVWIRPLPEMNAPWEPWGQQPTELVRVFRQLAGAIHAELPRTAVVWQPANGAGYPFDGAGGTGETRGTARDTALDTDGDGRVTSADDPYGPYWPGRDAVDWVGLAALHYGSSFPFTQNVRPPAGRLAAQLVGRYGYPDQDHPRQRNFYDRFVTGAGKPMVLQTSALYLPARGGPAEATIKRAWLKQVREVTRAARFSGVEMVLWQELRRREDSTRGLVADWRVTHSPSLATIFRDDLVRAGGLTSGPPGPSSAPATAPGGDDTSTGRELRGASAAAALVLVGALGVGVMVARRSRRRRIWAYPSQGARRDLRIDLLRGVAICFVVVDHLDIESLWQLVTQEFIGPVSGAELFVALSGVVLGTVYGRRISGAESWYDAATKMWRRALTLWVTALVVVTLVYLAATLPGIDARVLTTFADQGTGARGGATEGRIYDLYSGFDSLADFPVPAWALRDLLLLRMGPSQINIIGLYVVLLLVAPLMVGLLVRRRWVPLVLLSAALYAVGQLQPVRVLPSQFEDPFPLLDWQILFVLGLVAGWHRERLVAAARRPIGRTLVTCAVVLTVAFAVFSWCNPHLSNAYDVRLALMSDATFTRVYDGWFPRTTLGPGRLLAVVCLLVTAYAALTGFWTPINRTVGWLLIPLGQATLYIFVLHLVFVVAVANVPVLTRSVLLGTVTHAVVIALLWAMVRTRFLFKVVPR